VKYFGISKSHYSHALPADAARLVPACSASNVPDSALNPGRAALVRLLVACWPLVGLFNGRLSACFSGRGKTPLPLKRQI
jgi:hypothetical protein